MDDLKEKKCVPCEGGLPPLDYKEIHKYLKKVQILKDKHSKYNVEFLRTLVLLEEFDKAFAFSESVWDKDLLFFEGDLLIGLNLFKNKDYKNSEEYFYNLKKHVKNYNFYTPVKMNLKIIL